MTVLLIGLCGAAGAVCRFLVDTGVRRTRPTSFPVATTLVNVVGSVLLGAVAAAAAETDTVRLAVGAGFCGGYTTFSTAMYEAAALLRDRRLSYAFGYLVGLPVLCVVAAAAGYAIG